MDSLFLLPTQAHPCPRSEALSSLCSTARASRGVAFPSCQPLSQLVPPRAQSAHQAGLMRPRNSGLTWIWSEP